MHLSISIVLDSSLTSMFPGSCSYLICPRVSWLWFYYTFTRWALASVFKTSQSTWFIPFLKKKPVSFTFNSLLPTTSKWFTNKSKCFSLRMIHGSWENLALEDIILFGYDSLRGWESNSLGSVFSSSLCLSYFLVAF